MFNLQSFKVQLFWVQLLEIILTVDAESDKFSSYWFEIIVDLSQLFKISFETIQILTTIIWTNVTLSANFINRFLAVIIQTVVIQTEVIQTVVIQTVVIQTVVIQTVAIQTVVIQTVVIQTVVIQTVVIQTVVIQTVVIQTVVIQAVGIQTIPIWAVSIE